MLSLPAESFARRRQALLERLPVGSALLLPTAIEVLRSGDSHFPFRPDSDFYYATGFSEPHAVALLKRGADSTTFTLFVQSKDPEREVWTGIRCGTEGAVNQYGADQAWPIGELATQFKESLADVDSLYFNSARHQFKQT